MRSKPTEYDRHFAKDRKEDSAYPHLLSWNIQSAEGPEEKGFYCILPEMHRKSAAVQARKVRDFKNNHLAVFLRRFCLPKLPIHEKDIIVLASQ